MEEFSVQPYGKGYVVIDSYGNPVTQHRKLELAQKNAILLNAGLMTVYDDRFPEFSDPLYSEKKVTPVTLEEKVAKRRKKKRSTHTSIKHWATAF